MQRTFLSQVEAKRHQIITNLPEDSKGQNGQFMTPASVADAMVNMFSVFNAGHIRLLDPGAGSGSLMSAFLDNFLQNAISKKSLSIVAYEIDNYLTSELGKIADKAAIKAEEQRRNIKIEIINEDFISHTSRLLPLKEKDQKKLERFTHVIMNPPYRKLSSNSDHRKALSKLGVEVNNYYSAFVVLAVELLQDGGELVAITPRSFCNGPYFKPFREYLLKRCSFERIHLFESRQSAFREEKVLQENIIFKLVKNQQRNGVQISTSFGRDFKNAEARTLSHNRIVFPDDENNIVHIPTNTFDDYVLERMRLFPLRLDDIKLDVSTGPVVDFRVRKHIKDGWEDQDAPLIYPSHFTSNSICWPRTGRKPNAISVNTSTRKWLMPNGNYVLIRRFSSKEERRRIIPSLFVELDGRNSLIGFENHLNVIHSGGKGVNLEIAKGLVCYFASTLIDIYFRQFSGHTQVNASDLRILPIPNISFLTKLGKNYSTKIDTKKIDNYIEKNLNEESNISTPNPVEMYYS